PDREVHRPAFPVHRQGQSRAVRDPHPQAARGHPRSLVEDRRRPDATLAGSGRRHRDQDVMGSNNIGLIGRKVGMTQVFQDDGTMVAVSVLAIEPNTVTKLRTAERDGYTAVQIGAEPAKKLSKPETGQLKDLPKVATIREFRVDSVDDVTVGQVFSIGDLFEADRKSTRLNS